MHTGGDVLLRDGALRDGHGRRFEYLRLSLTEVCNFRCRYCLPDGYRRREGAAGELSPAEIVRAVRGFAALGLWKVRLTGGEPSVRRDFTAIARAVAATPGIRKLAVTTNGWRLARDAAAWREAGIGAVNVSVDSLDPARFAAITGHDRLAAVLAGIGAARAAGIAEIKLNAVLMRGVNDDELAAMADYVAEHDLTLRFIEVMRVNADPAFHARRHRPAADIVARLKAAGWEPLPRAAGAGPAIDYARPGIPGRIGVIAPYAAGFCDSCNRLRLSSEGRLHLCLFGEGGVDLRPLLQRDDQEEELVAAILGAMPAKTSGHRLREGDSGATPHLASIGG